MPGFRLPQAVLEAFNERAGRYGAKQRWMVASAAVLMALGVSDAHLDEVVQAVSAADVNDSFGELIARASQGLDPFGGRRAAARYAASAAARRAAGPKAPRQAPRRNRSGNR